MRVALTITGAFSASTGVGEGDGVASCARERLGALTNRLTNNNQQRGSFPHNKFPPFVERRTCLAGAESVHDSHSSFCEEVFSRRAVESRRSRTAATRRGTNEVERANILAPGLRRLTSRRTPSSRLHPRKFRGLALGSRIQLQQRNCSRFTRDFSRRSTDQTRKELRAEVAGLRLVVQDLFNPSHSLARVLT